MGRLPRSPGGWLGPLVCGLVLLRPGPLPAQGLAVAADTTRVTVGDRITLAFTAPLGDDAVLARRSLVLADSLPEGVRILSGGRVSLRAGRAEARLRVAIFRPGRVELPAFGLVYRPASGAPVDTLRSRPVPIEVVSILPPGDQPLKDIKDLVPLAERSNRILWLVLLGLVLLVGYLLYRRFRRRTVAAAPAPAAAFLPDPRTPYERALARLAEIERENHPARGEVARHYELVADVLRRYLEEAEGVPALERTTAELAWSLPPALAAAGLREDCRDLLGEADLVKFARVRPGAPEAHAHLVGARRLLERWHESWAERRSEAAARAATGAGDSEAWTGAEKVAGPGGETPAAAPATRERGSADAVR